jgi:uncharacterized protein DUF4372/DDE family transposase
VNSGKTIFSQLMDFLPSHEFRRCVDRYNGNYKLQRFSCWDQFLCMAFAQLTYRESLRDIEACLRSAGTKLYHMGIRSRVARNTLANANQVRDWRIYADFGQTLIGIARQLYVGDSFAVDLQNTVYALDSTMVDLCLSLFPWAKYRKRDGAIKIHTLLDLRGNIPSVVLVTPGKVHDVNFLQQLIFEPGSFYIMDRGYLDYERLHEISLAPAFFVIRAKSHIVFNRLYSLQVDPSTGVRSDQIITFSGFYAHKDYPDKLRRISFRDTENNIRLVFLTNNFTLPAATIADLYRCRWQVELFFRWIKQHLRIKAFYGTSENALKTQIWIAISVYVLVAIIKKRLNVNGSLYRILQILSVILFEKTSLIEALNDVDEQNAFDPNCNQLDLFN